MDELSGTSQGFPSRGENMRHGGTTCRPQRRPRRGGHRRRRAARGRDQRQRGLWLPRRHPGDDAGGLRRGRTPRCRAGCPGVLRRPGELRPRGAGRAGAGPARPGRRAGRGAVGHRRRRGRLGWCTSSRTGRSTTASLSTRRRPSPCWTGRATCPSSGCRGRCCSRGRVSGVAQCGWRDSPTAGTPTTDGSCRGTPRVHWSPTRTGSRREPSSWRAGVDSVCVHGDSAGAVATAGAVRRALEAAGLVRRPRCWSSDGGQPVHGPRVACGARDDFCGEPCGTGSLSVRPLRAGPRGT